MKLYSGKNKFIFFSITVCLLLTIAEIIVDRVWGDADGMITHYNIHKIIFTFQLVNVYFLFFIFINKFYLVFFKNKISANSVLLKAGKIFFILVIFISGFLVLEITSRYFFPSEGSFDRIYPTENARKSFPYIMFKGAANTPTGFGKEVYNKNGYRGTYPGMPKPEKEFRIIISGGSAVWEGEPSIPQLLEKEFHVNGNNNVRVYNFGVVSSVSSMELSTLFSEIINLSPDLVIMYNSANDMTLPLKYDPRPGYPFNFLVYENNPFLAQNYPALSLIGYKSNLMRVCGRKYFTERFSKISKLRKNVNYGTDTWRNEIADIYVHNLGKAVSLCNVYGIQFYSFLQPMVYFKKNLSGEEQEFINGHLIDRQHCILVHTQIMAKIKPEETDSSGFYFSDFSGFYDSASNQVFRDDVHTLQEAKPVIAREIYKKLSSTIPINN